MAVLLLAGCTQTAEKEWAPNTDWGHWILGHRSDSTFLANNNMTVTFGSGAPNFDNVTRAQFDSMMQEAKKFNKKYHDRGYIVLRYLSTSLNGDSKSNKDEPQKDQIHLLRFYNEEWNDFADYIGPKPAEDPTTWMMVRPDGSFPYYRYAPYGQETDEGFEAWGVPVNPDYVRYMEGRVRAQAETGIDGSYIDWTHIASETSYDKYSHDGFIAYLKANLPADIGMKKYGTSDYDNIKLPEKRGDNFWMEWITYRGHQVAEFHKHMRTTARKYNPHFMVSGNVFGGFGFGPIAYDGAGNMEMLAAEGYDDFIYSEMQEYLDAAPRRNDQGVKITNSPALKFLAAASHGKPVIVYATEITPPIFPDPTEKCLSAMAQMNIAEAVANHAIFREKRQTPPGATQIYSFLASQRQNLVGAHLDANVAILASLNQYLADEQSFAFSASRILADAGVNHVFIVEKDLLDGNLSRFDLIYLPYMPLLSVEKQQALVKYAEQGGQLVLLGACGVKDQYNVALPSVPLATALGSDSYPVEKTEKVLGKGKLTYLPLTIPDSKFLIPAKAGANVTTFGPSMADVFADIPEGYTRNRIDPALRGYLNSAAAEITARLDGKMSRIVQGTPYLEMTTMTNKSKNLMLVHLVNYDVLLDGTVTPAQGIQIEVAVPEGKKVKTLSYGGELAGMQPVEFTESNGVVRFEAPVVNIYGMALLQF